MQHTRSATRPPRALFTKGRKKALRAPLYMHTPNNSKFISLQYDRLWAQRLGATQKLEESAAFYECPPSTLPSTSTVTLSGTVCGIHDEALIFDQ